MIQARPSILFLGYGNPGRHDDGLGQAAAQAVIEWKLPNITVDIDYQLAVEDAATIAQHDIVIFADAIIQGEESFTFQEVKPESSVDFTSHSLTPPALLGLAHDIFKALTVGYVLAIRGYEFETYGEGLSAQSEDNLQGALTFLKPLLLRSDDQDFSTAATSSADSDTLLINGNAE